MSINGAADGSKRFTGHLRRREGHTAATRVYAHTLTGTREKITAAPKGDGCAAHRRKARQKPNAKKMSINTTCCPPSSSMSTTGARGTTRQSHRGARRNGARGTCYLNTRRRYQKSSRHLSAIYARRCR